MKPVQYFSDDYLEQSRQATPIQILECLEQFRLMQGATVKKTSPSKLISLKVQQDLLSVFRTKCEIEGLKYQTQIKALMTDWVKT